jgi:hypothetical protein
MTSGSTRRIRLGVLTFLVVGVIAIVGALTPGIGINPAADPAGFAQAADLVGLANLAGIVALALQLYGFQALHAFLTNTSEERPAFLGMVLSTLGVALFLPFLGIIAIVGPVAGRAYLNGQTQAIKIISDTTSINNPIVFAVGGASVLLFVLGSILFSVAIWRSGRIPKWSAVAYAIAAPLNIVPHYIPALWIGGGILLVIAGAGIVRGTWKNLTI